MSCSRLSRVRERCAWLVQAGHPQRQYRTVGTELTGERVEGGGPGCVSHLTSIKKKKTHRHTHYKVLSAMLRVRPSTVAVGDFCFQSHW